MDWQLLAGMALASVATFLYTRHVMSEAYSKHCAEAHASETELRRNLAEATTHIEALLKRLDENARGLETVHASMRNMYQRSRQMHMLYARSSKRSRKLLSAFVQLTSIFEEFKAQTPRENALQERVMRHISETMREAGSADDISDLEKILSDSTQGTESGAEVKP